MNCETTNLSKKQISELFRVHINTIDGWIKGGLPYRKDGREYRFDLADVIAWHHSFISNIAGDMPSFSEAKRQKEYYQAELKRLQFETAEGQLLRKDILLQKWIPIVQAMKQRLLAMPSKLTPILFGCKTKAEIAGYLTRATHEALVEISEEKFAQNAQKGRKRNEKVNSKKH